MNITAYAKTWGPLVVALLTVLLTFDPRSEFGDVAPVGWIAPALAVVLALLNVVLTWRFPNGTEGIARYAKLWANIAHVVLQAALVVILGVGGDIAQLTFDDFRIVALAAVGAVATWLLPNEPLLAYVEPVPAGEDVGDLYGDRPAIT